MLENDFPHYWTYNDTPLDELSREDLIVACEVACEEVHRLREENRRLLKLSIWASPEWAEKVNGNA